MSKVGGNPFSFTAISEDGGELRCTALFYCGAPLTSGDVIVYTDGTIDEDGDTKVYASKINMESFTGDDEWASVELSPLEEGDWEVVEVLLGLFQSLAITGYSEEEIQDIAKELMNQGIDYAQKFLEYMSTE